MSDLTLSNDIDSSPAAPSPPSSGARGPEPWRRLAVLEAVCAGLCGPSPEPSLLAEGRAMRDAIVTDLRAIAGCEVVCEFDLSASPSAWDAACDDADAALIIAPETNGLLERLVQTASQRPRLLNASPAAIRLCSDKRELAWHLFGRSIRTLPTVIETWQTPFPEPCVIKPRDGAGSWLVRHVTTTTEWQQVREEYSAAAPNTVAVRQPFIEGRALSVAAWFGEDFVDWLPVGEQRLSDDGRFRYLGGRLPAAISDEEAAAVRKLVEATAAAIPGLRGYIGFDVLQPIDQTLQPLLVEINPRFTTSYVGYRRLFAENLLARWLPASCVTAVSAVRALAHTGMPCTADTAVAHRGIEFDPTGEWRELR